MTWNDLAPIYRVLLLTVALLLVILVLFAVIGALWLLARRMLWAFLVSL